MTTWIGASLGGRIKPWSSPWVMMIAPMKRVESPQDVVQQYCMLVVLIQVLDIKGFGKILTEEVGCTSLQCPGITHHGFDGVGMHRAGKFFSVAFSAGDDRDSGFVNRKIGYTSPACAGFLLQLPFGWHGRCVLPASRIQACAGIDVCAFPSARHFPIG